MLLGKKWPRLGPRVWPGQDEPGLHKQERDKRSPAGIFKVGKVYGYEATLPPGGDYPYHQVGDARCVGG